MSTEQKAGALGVILPIRGRVEGLDVPPAEAGWLGLPLKERQERAFLNSGLRPGPDDPERERVVVAADTALLPGAVQAVLELGRQAGEPVSIRVGGELGRFVEEALLDRDPFLAAYLPAGSGPAEPARLRELPRVELDPQERSLELPVPPSLFGAELLQVPLSERLLFPTGHWVQLLWANLLGLAPYLWRELVGRSGLSMVLRLAWAALRARSTYPYRVAGVLGRRGRGCHVHPSAVVEGSWLGDGVEVGAGAVVRGSVLADGVRVEDQALVEFSVLGRGATALRKSWVKFSLLEPGASCAGAMQLGVLGRGAAVKYGATLMDVNYAQGVQVRAGRGLLRAPLGVVGVCVGPETVLGSGVRVAPGRALPGKLVVVPDPADVLSRLPAGLEPGEYAVRAGGLERL